MLPKSIPGGPREHFRARNGPGGGEGVILMVFGPKRSPFGEAFGGPFRFFCVLGLWDTKKWGSGRAFKTRPVFLSILGSARRASGGFPCTRELNFHFFSRTPKGSKMGAHIGPKSTPKLTFRRLVFRSAFCSDF